ncbi:MAG TPA: hypothetical protein VJ810_42070 [Blastocatellia bacterium]|nr:hypothetical protein [Blastocatellia bacterium]
MKRALTICGVFCALMIGVAAVSAQKGANFAGTWELDKSKSKLPEQMASNLTSLTWTVTQSETELKIEPKAEMAQTGGGGGGGGGGRGGGMGGNQPSAYKLDGSETTTDLTGRMTGKVTRKAKWAGEGKILELSAVTNADFNGNAFTSTTTEHWELADGGKSLKVHRKSETPRGAQETTYVFNKK